MNATILCFSLNIKKLNVFFYSRNTFTQPSKTPFTMESQNSFAAKFKQIQAPPWSARHRVASWDVEHNLAHDIHIWSCILAHGEKNHSAKKKNTNSACIIAFTSSRTLPKDVAGTLVDFIDTPIKDTTIAHVSKFCRRIPAKILLRYGRGGEGLSFNLKYRNPKQWLRKNQHPRLPFSQPEFRNEIRKQGDISLFRRLKLHGSVKSQLETFLIELHYKY